MDIDGVEMHNGRAIRCGELDILFLFFFACFFLVHCIRSSPWFQRNMMYIQICAIYITILLIRVLTE